jgi:Ribosomal protein L4/L1 family
MSFLARLAQRTVIGTRKNTPGCISKYPITKAFSTNANVVANIPSNLRLSNPNVLDDEVEKIFFSPEMFMFPPLNIPKSTVVSMFNSPGQNAEEPAPLEKMIFGVAIRKDIVHEVIRYQRRKIRQPKKTKRMSEISGSNKKPRPQKGGGSAQVGHKRNSVWRGGQKAHGPVLRDYSISLNRKFRAMGLMIALTAKFREGNMIVFDNISIEVRLTSFSTCIIRQLIIL